MVDEDQTVTVIDFPQMVSISHRNAQYVPLPPAPTPAPAPPPQS